MAAAEPTAIEPFVGSVRHKDATLDLLIYWRGLARRKWAILGFAIALAAVAAVLVNLQTPIYRSTVTLLIEQNRAKVAPTEEVYASAADSREHFQTQAEILRSRALAMRVVEKLDLTNHPDFDPRQRKASLGERIRAQLGFPVKAPQWNA